MQHELAGEKWSLQCEADAVRRLGCLARDRGKEYQKHFSPEPCKSSGRDFTHSTVSVLMLIEICTGEQMDESTPQKTSINSVKTRAEFRELIARGMQRCVKRCVCVWSLLGLSQEHFRGLGMHAGLSPCHVEEDTIFFLVVLCKIIILLN